MKTVVWDQGVVGGNSGKLQAVHKRYGCGYGSRRCGDEFLCSQKVSYGSDLGYKW